MVLLSTTTRRSTSEVRADVAHLVRRAAYGAPPEEVEALAALGYEGAVDVLCDLAAGDQAADAVEPPRFDTASHLAARRGDVAAREETARRLREERRALALWWVRRMVAAERPVKEKLTFLWHDHFATSIAKVKLPELMYLQQRTLHRLGAGRFDELLHAVARDPAMLVWLDGRHSTAEAPNENFARELLELFTLGHGEHHGGQPYTERDVTEAARALTGWVIDRSGAGRFDPRRHDSGTKIVLGTTGRLGLDEVVGIVTRHPACAPHVVARLWSRLARPATPADPVVQDLAAGFARDLDVAALLRRMFLHPAFLAPETRTALVRTPIDHVVGLARTLGLDLDERVLAVLAGMGQVPFVPPDVSGWPANEAWLSTATAQVRLQLAVIIGEQVGDRVLSGTARAGWPGELARLLGVESWGAATTDGLRAAADASQALTVALVAPEQLV